MAGAAQKQHPAAASVRRDQAGRRPSRIRYAPGDVEAGRRYGHAYVEFTHYAEALPGLLQWVAAAAADMEVLRVAYEARLREAATSAGLPASELMALLPPPMARRRSRSGRA